jgi:Arc/MetJ-type ribon-helix-helix transcriptional regulator
MVNKYPQKGVAMESTSDNNKVAVKIPEELYRRIQEEIKNTGFSTVDDYITYFLHIKLGKKNTKTESTTKEDDEKVVDQLKSLGYL